MVQTSPLEIAANFPAQVGTASDANSHINESLGPLEGGKKVVVLQGKVGRERMVTSQVSGKSLGWAAKCGFLGFAQERIQERAIVK